MSKMKRAIFIAAGEGKRLRPVTLETPKPLVEVHGTRIIDSSIQALRKCGIHEFYIIVGYKKEKFYEAYGDDPEVTIIENTHYLEGNNITSLYLVNDKLEDAFVLEADLLIKDESIFDIDPQKSGYMASKMEPVPEWALTVEDERITECCIEGSETVGLRLWGISVWLKEDAKLLAEKIRYEYEDKENWQIYWDMIPLFSELKNMDLGAYEIPADAICEIDTLQELQEIDPIYKNVEA